MIRFIFTVFIRPIEINGLDSLVVMSETVKLDDAGLNPTGNISDFEIAIMSC